MRRVTDIFYKCKTLFVDMHAIWNVYWIKSNSYVERKHILRIDALPGM